MAATHEPDTWINPRDPALANGPDGRPARSRRASVRLEPSNQLNTRGTNGATPLTGPTAGAIVRSELIPTLKEANLTSSRTRK